MPIRAWRLAVLLTLVSCVGCAAFAESVLSSVCGAVAQAAWNAVWGIDKSEEERRELDRCGEPCNPPGRSELEVERERLNSFRRQSGRDPKLEWSERPL